MLLFRKKPSAKQLLEKSRAKKQDLKNPVNAKIEVFSKNFLDNLKKYIKNRNYTQIIDN